MKLHPLFFLTAALVALVGMNPPVHADVLRTDDQIVVGSVAVGFDAVLDRNFGEDTIVTVENNLRIYFEDTSVNPGEPANDWRMLANDTGSGGLNLFTIEDASAALRLFTLVAGAPANSLHVASSGRLGLGTDVPATSLHLLRGEGLGLRLDQDNSTGGTPWAWDLKADHNGVLLQDVTGGGSVPLKIFPGTPTDSLVVSGSGAVGMGTGVPHARMHVAVNSVAGEGVIIGAAGIPTNLATLHVGGTLLVTQSLEVGSSRARKENVGLLGVAEARDVVADLEPVRFNYLGAAEDQCGFIAEDLPELVATEGRASVTPMDLAAVLTRVVQDQERIEGELQAGIKERRQVLDTLAKRITELEAGKYAARQNSEPDESR